MLAKFVNYEEWLQASLLPELSVVCAHSPGFHQCWAPSSIGSVVTDITPRRYELFYEVGPDRPALVSTHAEASRHSDWQAVPAFLPP